MKVIPKYGMLVLYLITLTLGSYSQGLNGFNQPSPYITAHFRAENLTVEPETAFFNVLIIENKGETREDIQLEFNAPIGWSVMTGETNIFTINPNDSILIPLRAAPSKWVEGEIGYSLIASINTRLGETLTNAYCFIKIPRQSNLAFRPVTRVGYFDQQTGQSELSFRLINDGNVNELIYMNFISTENVEIINERDNIFNLDVRVRARSDTIITLPVKMVENHNMRNGGLYRIDMTGYTEDLSFKSSFWFNHLSNSFRFRVPESEKMMIAEISAQNLLSDQKAFLTGGVRGNILMQNRRQFSYRLYKYGSNPDFYRYSRVRAEYSSPKLYAAIGDITGFPIKYGFGKGAEIGLPISPNYRISLLAGQNAFRPIDNYGVVFEEKSTGLNLFTRYSYTDNLYFNSVAQTAGTRGNINISRGHNLRFDIGLSDVLYKTISENRQGMLLNLDYNGRYRNTTISLRERLGTINYYGSYSGRHDFQGRISTPLNENYHLDLLLFDRSYRPTIESIEGVRSNRFNDTREFRMLFRRHIDRNFSVFGGPLYQRKSTNSYFLFNGTDAFSTNSAKALIGIRVRDAFGLSFNPSLTLGYTFLTNYSVPDPQLFIYDIESLDKSFFNSHLSLNIRKGQWGTYLNYFYGPYSINQEISQFYYRINAHSIRVMPYFETYVYKDMVLLSSKLNYLYDFAFKTNRVNLNNQLEIFLAHDLTLSLLNTLSYQLTQDVLTEEKYTYANNYFEVRLKKEFNWNQPRIKYYDLTVNLFKDLNGNLRRDFNEPGVKDILVSITSIDPLNYDQFDVDYSAPDKMVSTRLLSGMDGTITYQNLPMGLYRIELQNIGRDQDKYFPDQNEYIINVTGDKTFYIPYLERNRIFGRVIMNRSKLSNLGRVEVSNLRVSATDSKGRTTTTLTDGNGNFEMYVPSVDSYMVTINDIFQEHFNLRQNNFRANLNGFKQFEVNFVFDEIRRQIEFTPSPAELDAEIRRVGRTNLTGNVRDASTLQGLRAQVEIINNETSASVERTLTDRSTGRYSTSFITYDNYSIIVTAPGYWMHSERLILDPYLAIQDVERDVLLENIVIGSTFQLANLNFAPGSSEIPNEAIPELDRLIRQLRDNPNVRIRIVGHSDATETLDDRNISARRAEAVMRYMVQNGFSNIEFTGLEASQPLAPNDTEDNRRRNRRVEIVIVDK
jgi:outer membrane protein OmpA-like peptidoglycan-associated protein